MTLPFVSRVNQIDAVQLDEEIYKVLRNQADAIIKYFPPGKVVKWTPEIDVFVKYLIWNYSLKRNSSTFGQQLLNFSYKNLDRRKAVLLFIFLALPNYLRQRLISENYILSKLPSNYMRSKYKYYVEEIDNFFHLLDFIWSFFFLHLGNQPRYIEKLLGIYNESSKINQSRSIGYSYMTRELLWHGLMELFTVILPMIDLRYIQKLWHRLWLQKKKEKKVIPFQKLEATTLCAYCKELPILPRWASCSHVFCYYCLKALFMIMDPYQCPICDEDLHLVDMKAYINV